MPRLRVQQVLEIGEMRRALEGAPTELLQARTSEASLERFSAYGEALSDLPVADLLLYDATAARWELLRRVAFGLEPPSCLT